MLSTDTQMPIKIRYLKSCHRLSKAFASFEKKMTFRNSQTQIPPKGYKAIGSVKKFSPENRISRNQEKIFLFLSP